MKDQKQISADQSESTAVISLKPYQTLDESTGEVLGKYKYLEATPANTGLTV